MTIIDNYRALPLGKYLAILELTENTELDDLTRQVEIISILAGTSADDILNLPIDEYKECVIKSRFLTRVFPGNLIIAKSYKVGDFDLLPVTKYDKITTAQYIDFQQFIKEGKSRFAELLSCLMIPKGKKYNDGYDITEVHEAIKQHLSAADTLSLSAFFLRKLKQLMEDSLTYCKKEALRMNRKEIVEMIRKVEITLNASGVGLNA